MSFPRKYNTERHLASCRSRLSTEGSEVIVIRGSFRESASQTSEINNSVSRDSPSLALVYSTSDVDMDNGSFSGQSLSGFGNQNSGILVDNGFSIGSSSTGILNDIEEITTDNGISSDVPSSEPVHLSDEESDDEELEEN
ncbi:hypothetical protein A0J61_11748 [Choanephora cucurbitarum]|uniref:Uncharacterized protein n=1 Tax=Choanephora cucurbitarum TaxID=101091 RepID=A0A1C7MTN1_9FUNG|nr:hypothetical protein A0J61_11748 [Choanephora cucurbitarum]